MVSGPAWRPPGAERCCDGVAPKVESGSRYLSQPSSPADPVGTHSYPKRVRLRRRTEYLRVQRMGKRTHTPSFVIVRHPTGSQGVRLGITVSSKVGNAVVRNRIKRRVRESFRVRRSAMSSGFDVVVIAKQGAHDLTFSQIERELVVAFGFSR